MSRRRPEQVKLARQVVTALGGQFSTEMGIAPDAGPGEVERWFLAASLFGTRISARIAIRTFATLNRAGIRTITDAGARSWDELVALLDAGGYARYDFRTATRLQQLAAAVEERFPGGIATLGERVTDPRALKASLDALPGMGTGDGSALPAGATRPVAGCSSLARRASDLGRAPTSGWSTRPGLTSRAWARSRSTPVWM